MGYAVLRVPGLKPRPARPIELIVEELQMAQRVQLEARIAVRKAVRR